jgi:hypothetical protein
MDDLDPKRIALEIAVTAIIAVLVAVCLWFILGNKNKRGLNG